MADAKAGFKAEMDAPGWQRGAGGGGRGGDRAEGHLVGSSGCKRQHTWSLQAAGSRWPAHYLKAGTLTLSSMG